MKRFLPMILAAGVVLLSGCYTGDGGDDHAEAAEHTAGSAHPTPEHAGESIVPEVAGTTVSQTASAFPASTPPSGKESITPVGYWTPRRVNTQLAGHANVIRDQSDGQDQH